MHDPAALGNKSPLMKDDFLFTLVTFKMLPLAFCCVGFVSGKIYAKGFTWCQLALTVSQEPRQAFLALVSGKKIAASQLDVYFEFFIQLNLINYSKRGFFRALLLLFVMLCPCVAGNF